MWSHEFLEKMYAGKRVQSTLGTGETARIIGSRSALVSKGIDDDGFIKTVIVVVRDTDQKELEIELSDMGVLVAVIDEVKEADPCKQIVTDTHDKEQGTLTYHDVESRHVTRGTSTWTPIDSGSVHHWALGAFNSGYQFRNRHTQTPISREEFMEILRPIQKDILPFYGDVEYSIGDKWHNTNDFTLSGWADGNFAHNYRFRNANTGRNIPRETFIEIAKRHMTERAEKAEAVWFTKYKHPLQPVKPDEHGRDRFVKNQIVDRLLEHGQNTGLGLNELAGEDFEPNDWRQLAQLIGYSVDGFFTLSYVCNTWDEDRFEDGYYEAAERSLAEREGE